MFIHNVSKFESKKVLKLSMLEDLRDFPRDFFNINFKNNSDGIFSGCEINVEEDEIVVNRGLLIFKGYLFMLTKNYKIKYEANDRLNILKVRFSEENKKEQISPKIGRLYLDLNEKISENEFELCRFKLKSGARLRNDYVDFEDINTEYDTVGIINTFYSSYKEPSISPFIVKSFANELILNKLESIDYSFIFTVLNEKLVIDKEVLVNYINLKLGIKMEDKSNKSIYKYFLKILKESKKEEEVLNGYKSNYKRILLDT